MKTSPDVRTCHDEWSKRALALWLKELGDVVLDARIAGESRRGDVLFTERRTRAAYRRKLGTLGELAHGRVLFEPFRNPLTVLELKSCVRGTRERPAGPGSRCPPSRGLRSA